MAISEPALVFAGTAGAGKSTLTAATEAWLGEHNVDPLTVNLDPGAGDLPYDPGVDIRDHVTIDEVMEEYKLGPNGAQIAAADLIATEFGAVQERIEAYSAEVVLVDTPGQLELFAFRASGPFVTQEISDNPMLVFLLDPAVASSARGFVSQAVLAATAHFRLQVPTLNVLGKVDTLDDDKVSEIVSWTKDSDQVLDELYKEPATMVNQLNESFTRVLDDFQAIAETIPVSSTTMEGIEDIYTLVSNQLHGGEDTLVDTGTPDEGQGPPPGGGPGGGGPGGNGGLDRDVGL
jgi:GTPase SAR1 family protein